MASLASVAESGKGSIAGPIDEFADELADEFADELAAELADEFADELAAEFADEFDRGSPMSPLSVQALAAARIQSGAGNVKT